MDWKLLRTQKELLLQYIKVYKLNNNLMGIIHLIDDIQDYAYDILGIEEVFE